MSSANTISIHPSLKLIFPREDWSNESVTKKMDGIVNKEDIDADTAWHFYSHSIRRNPNDLTLHTHRVFFAMHHKDATLLSGSLYDIFYVLKDAGKMLRIRLLQASLPYLSRQDTLYFAMWIKTDKKNSMDYQWVNGSVLSDGLSGANQNLITMEASEEHEVAASSLKQARASMEDDRFDIAQQIIQGALAIDPDNPILNEELAYLNRYMESRQIDPPKKVFKSNLGGTFERIKNKIFG